MRIAAFILFIFSFCSVKAQQFGGNPPSVKWQQINTSDARIIFPEKADSTANIVANTIDEIRHHNRATIGNKLKKINIVLQNGVTYSNAYVSLAPYRSEFYLMPQQNAFELSAQNWAYTLTLHEFRHVQQYSNFNVGLSKTMSVLFGENGQALANAAAIPDWFFEGDAVYNETRLSRQGRGRLPLFFNGFKSLYYENKHYNYSQLRNGSFKKYIPDHYELGYLLVAYGREKYSDDFWKNITHEAASFKPLFYPLQNNIKKNTGEDYNRFIKNAFNYYHHQWNDTTNSNAVNWITNTRKNNVVNYKYPYTQNDGSIITLKNSYKDIAAFYRVNTNGTETKIGVRDIAYDDYFSYNNDRIIYASLQPDIRWSNQEYSAISILNLPSGERKKITSHTKYFTPDISHNGKLIVAVKIEPNRDNEIVLMDTAGREMQSWNCRNCAYSYPKFSNDDEFLYAIIRNDIGEMGIEKINLSDSSVNHILSLNNRIIGFPVVQGDTLLYTCSNNGNDEIWAYINTRNKHYRLASYRTGLYQGSMLSDGQLIASAFTAEGYRLAAFLPKWEPVNLQADTLVNLYLTKPFTNEIIKVSDSDYHHSKKYSRFTHPFNLHSWAPYISYPDYSFIIYGENILNTFQTQLYYTYNTNENYSQAGASEFFGGWFLQPFINVNQTWNRNVRINADTSFSWNEFNASAGLQLPLNFTGGRQYRNFTLSTSYNINKLNYTGFAKQFFTNSIFSYLQTRLRFTAQSQQAIRQINPPFAYTFLVQLRNNTSKETAKQLLLSSSIFLPGVAKTHSLVLNAAYQMRDTAANYYYSNNFPFSRGYEAFDFPRMYKLGINYHFPIFYPDWGFGNIVYFLRIRANTFFDNTNIRSLRTGNHYNLNSVGTELYFDTKWWNEQPLTFGFRYSRLLNYDIAGMQPNRWEAILPLTLF